MRFELKIWTHIKNLRCTNPFFGWIRSQNLASTSSNILREAESKLVWIHLEFQFWREQRYVKNGQFLFFVHFDKLQLHLNCSNLKIQDFKAKGRNTWSTNLYLEVIFSAKGNILFKEDSSFEFGSCLVLPVIQPVLTVIKWKDTVTMYFSGW